MAWQIEKVESFEAAKIRQDLWEKLSEVKGIILNQRYEQLFVARNHQNVIGIGISWLNAFHPTAVYFRIFISDQAKEGHKVADALFHQIKLATVHQDKWIWAGWEPNQHMGDFLERNSFELMRKTYTPAIQITDIQKQLAHIEQADNYISLKETLNNPVLKESFFTLVKDTYTATHQVNPVNNYSLEEWEEILLNDSPDTENSLICLHPAAPHHVEGYIMLYPIDGQQYEAGWVGLSGKAEPILLRRLLKNNWKT